MAQTDINLTPGEKGLYSISFRPNLVLFWLRSTFLVTNRRIAVKTPNTILGIIPLGFEERSIPMGSVAGLNASVTVKAGRLILFGILAILSLFGMQESWVFFLFFLLFTALALNAILASLDITNNGGGVSSATVSILDKSALEKFKDKANEYIYSATTAGTSWDEAMHNPQQFAPPQGFGATANTQFNMGYQPPLQQPQAPQHQHQQQPQWGQPQQGQWGQPQHQQQPQGQWGQPQAPQHQQQPHQQPQWGQPQQGQWGQPQHQQPQQNTGGSTAVNFDAPQNSNPTDKPDSTPNA